MRKRKPLRAIGLVAAALVTGGMVAATASTPSLTAEAGDTVESLGDVQVTTVMWADSLTGDGRVVINHPDGTTQIYEEGALMAARVAGMPSSVRAAAPGAAAINPAMDYSNPPEPAKVGGVPAHWDQCRNTIRYAVNLTNVPDSRALDEVHQAFSRLSNVSGYKFQYVGSTKVVPLLGMNGEGKQSFGPVWSDALLADPNRQADIYITWAGPTEVPAFGDMEGRVAAITVPSYLSHRDVNRENEIGLAGVAFYTKYAKSLPKGFVNGGRAVVMMHELTHAMGLDHAAGMEQIMYPVIGTGSDPKNPQGTANTSFGLGDKAGLQVVGAFGGNSLQGFSC